MIKTRTTKKAIRADYDKIICIGYCSAQNLLAFSEPAYYTTRTEGWASDIYDVDGVAISTGYAAFGNIKPSYDLTNDYDRRAAEIRADLTISYDERRDKVNALLLDFVEEVTK